MRRSLRALLGLVLLAAGGLGAAACAAPAEDPGYATVHSIGAKASPFRGTPIDQPYRLPKATWTDTSGAKVSWPAGGLPKPVTVVFFAYTHCPDVCPTQLADLTQAIRASDPQVQEQTAVVVATVDPKRDDAQTLRTFLDGFDKTLPNPYVGLRNDDLEDVEEAAESLGIALTGKESDKGGGYEVGHGAQLIGFGPDGTAPVIWLPGTPVGDIRADLATLAQGR